MFHSVSRKFAKREKKKLIHKALFTIVVIVNVNKLSWFLKKHYFVQSFLTIESCNTIFLSLTKNLIFWSWKQQDVKINSFVTCTEMFLCGHLHMTFRLWHLLCAEEGSTGSTRFVRPPFKFHHLNSPAVSSALQKKERCSRHVLACRFRRGIFSLNSSVMCGMRGREKTTTWWE